MNNFFNTEFLKVYKIEIIMLCIFSCLTSIFTLLSPYLIQYIVDDVITNKNIDLLMPILFQLMFLYIFSALSTFVENYIEEYLKIRIFKDKTTILLPILINNSNNLSTGDLISRLTDNLRSINSLLCHIVPRIVLNILSLVVPFCIMFYINSQLCLITITPIFLCFFLFYILGDKIEKIEIKLLESNSKIFSFFKEVFSINELINSYNLHNFFINKYYSKINTYQEETLYYAKYSSITMAFECILTGIPMLILIIFGTYLLIHGNLTLGNFIAFISYISLFFAPMMELGSNWMSYKTLLPAISRIKELYDLNDENDYRRILEIDKGFVELDTVSFSFDFKILSNFSCTFYPGINYLVGDNGSGKSTILKLICKVYSPDNGFIKIDGQDIRNVSMGDLSKYVGIVFSEPYLFEDTIYNNLVLGISDIEKVDVFNACKKVNVHEFIMSLPNQYNTIIKEEGCNFSAGEKQKISLARVLIRNPKIILLDEVTRSIDKKSKAEIKESIHSLKDEKTIIIVDHEFCEVSSDFNIVKL